MQSILVIENDQADFEEIRNRFSQWDVRPSSISEIESYEINNVIEFVMKQLEHNADIEALIVDISLTGRDDRTGLELIKAIRSKDNLNCKIIPIFCYSKHDSLKIDALKAGATNFFSKNSLIDKASYRYKFLEQSVIALAFLYRDAKDHAQRLSDFDEIYRKLDENISNENLILASVLQLLKLDDLNEILSDKELEDMLVSKIGQNKVEDLKNMKLDIQNKKELQEHLDEISNILSETQVLAPFAAIIRVIKLISK